MAEIKNLLKKTDGSIYTETKKLAFNEIFLVFNKIKYLLQTKKF